MEVIIIGGKVGRNDPCPCGSGKKYKQCCLPRGDMRVVSNGLIAKHYPSGQIIELGSPGVKVCGCVIHNTADQEKMAEIERNIADYDVVLDLDVPFLLPLGDDRYTVRVGAEVFTVFHQTKQRGQQMFSTLDSTLLPYFSHIQIHGSAFSEKCRDGEPFPSYLKILAIIEKMNESLKMMGHQIAGLSDRPVLSYQRMLLPRNKPYTSDNAALISTYPYSGVVDLMGPETKPELDDEQLKAYLSQSFKLTSFIDENTRPILEGKTFAEKAFLTLHDFAYYSRQSSRALHQMPEEWIRDLYMVVPRMIFGYAEAESFNFDGKLDFKLINPENKYQYISGEFKRWRGEDSFKEVFHQAVRKHATGQEHFIYILVLSGNRELGNVIDKAKALCLAEEEVIAGSEQAVSLPLGSKEAFVDFAVAVRGNRIPLRVGFIDLYYQKVAD